MGKEGLGEEHRETRNSIWKKKKGVVVLEKQKKIKHGKNKSRGRRKGTKKQKAKEEREKNIREKHTKRRKREKRASQMSARKGEKRSGI